MPNEKENQKVTFIYQMNTENSNNRRIAKNTMMLYFRMIIIMGVQLYTVRIVLDVLGASDYGLYNVVGGVVSMLAFLSGTMSTASQRYFAFEIGRGDSGQLRKTFSMTLLIYVLIGVIILLLLETVGLWFLNHKISMGVGRIYAANWVYQFAIVSLFLTMFQTPYSAMVIAHERMNFFAYVGVLEVILKLIVVYLLMFGSYDKLMLFGLLNLAVTFLVTTINRIYCLRNFEESHFQYYWNKSLFKEIMSYSGWNLFGALAGIMNNQGINIVLNMFFGPVINAARAVAFQISTTLNQFVQNFMTATRPQITKYYAQGNNEQMLKLVFQSSKFSFFLLFFVSLPVLLEMPFILKIWLKDVPQYTVLFAQLIIIGALIDTLSYSLMATVQATGRIKIYQSLVGSVMLLNLPISYLFLKFNFSVETVFYIAILNSIVCLQIRLLFLKKMVKLKLQEFYKMVILRIVLVVLLSTVCIIPITKLSLEPYFTFFIVVSCSSIFVPLFIYIIGINKNEMKIINRQILTFKNNIARWLKY
ncbi:MAG: oligosaccharide flippase family protein [Dysgonamonadaceae bacterium]